MQLAKHPHILLIASMLLLAACSDDAPKATPDQQDADMASQADMPGTDQGDADMSEADQGEADQGDADMSEADQGDIDMSPAPATSFTQVEGLTNISTFGVSEDGTIYVLAANDAYRMRLAQAPELLGTPNPRAARIYAEGDAAHFQSGDDNHTRLQYYADAFGAATIIDDLSVYPRRVWHESLYVIQTSNAADTAPCLTRVEADNTLSNILCMPTLNAQTIGFDAIIYTIFGDSEQDASFLLRDGTIVDPDGTQHPNPLREHLGGALAVAQAQQTANTLWVRSDRGIHRRSGDAWTTVALPDGVQEAHQLYAVDDDLAWIVSRGSIYRYQAGQWSAITLGFEPSRAPTIGGSAPTGLVFSADGKLYLEDIAR